MSKLRQKKKYRDYYGNTTGKSLLLFASFFLIANYFLFILFLYYKHEKDIYIHITNPFNLFAFFLNNT